MEERPHSRWKHVGESPGVRSALQLVEHAAGTHHSVLITGERGTGKKAVARALHHQGPRSHGPFVLVSCAAKPEGQLRGELMGEPSSATGAVDSSFARARGGTLLLDEVVALPQALQAEVALILARRPPVRVVATTSSDLANPIVSAQLREDLFDQLSHVAIALPPLRARGSDVLLLAQHFLERAGRRQRKEALRLSAPAADRLLAYGWPGNIPELRSCIAHAMALARHETVLVEDLPERIQAPQTKADVGGGNGHR